MHLALVDSIKTESQMKNLSYDTMKEVIVEEIMKVKNLNSSTYDVNQKDEIHLKMFKQGEFEFETMIIFRKRNMKTWQHDKLYDKLYLGNSINRNQYLVVCGDIPVKSNSVGSIPTLNAGDSEENRNRRVYGANLR